MTESGAAGNSAQLLHLVSKVLQGSGVRWGTIGALAVAYHGWIRASLDADALITLKESESDIDALLLGLKSQGWTVEFREGEEDDPLGFVIRIQDGAGNQVDLIGGIKRLDPGFFDRLVKAELHGLHLLFASPEDLIALKIYAGGPKDIEDAAGILDVLGPSFDPDLLLTLCRRFGKAEADLAVKLLNRRSQ